MRFRFVMVLIVLVMLGSMITAQDELPTLDDPIVWYLRAGISDVQDGVDAVNEAVNAYLAERDFNAEVQITYLDRSEFDDRLALINAAFEQYDMALTTYSWVNQYPANVENEYFIPLTAYENPDTGEVENLFELYAPELWASMPAEAWDAARVDGEVYAVINQQIWPKPFGISMRTDIIEALDLQDEWDAIEDWADLTPIMEQVQTAIDDGTLADGVADGANLTHAFATIGLFQANNFGYDGIAPYCVIDINDPEMTVVNFTSTDAWRGAAELRREWQAAGFTTPEVLDLEAINNGYAAGQFAMDVGRLIKPGGALEQAARYGYEWSEKIIAPVMLTTDGPVSTMTGISTSIEDDPVRVARVMMFLEMVHTDPMLYNLIAKGVEGTHWEWVDPEQNLIAKIEGSGYNPNVDWAIGNQFNAYYIDPGQVGAWEESLEMNQNAQPSPALGFVFDRTPVENQIIALDGVIAEFMEPITEGQIEDLDAAIAELLAVMEDNGVNDICAEAQAQIDAWKMGE